MFSKILVPLDGSVLSEVTLPYAEELAGKLGSQVTLIFIGDAQDNPYQNVLTTYIEKIAETVKEGAKKHVSKLHPREAEVKHVMLTGNIAEQITQYAEKNDIDLIIMSSHGHGGFRHWNLGGIADKVARATRKPVAIIRAEGASEEVREKGAFNKILVTLDGSKASEAALPYAEYLGSNLKTEIILLHVFKPDYFTFTPQLLKNLEEDREAAHKYLSDVERRLKGKGINVSSKYDESAEVAAECIINHAEESKVDAVLMSTRGHSGITRWALGSTAEKVLREGKRPLILVPAVS